MEGNKDLEKMKEKPGEVPLFISSLVVNVQPKLQKGACVTPHLSEVFGFLTFSHTSEREQSPAEIHPATSKLKGSLLPGS